MLTNSNNPKPAKNDVNHRVVANFRALVMEHVGAHLPFSGAKPKRAKNGPPMLLFFLAGDVKKSKSWSEVEKCVRVSQNTPVGSYLSVLVG